MNSTIKLLVNGTDRVTVRQGFTTQSYLYLGETVTVTVPDQHVEWLEHLASAAAQLAAQIRAREPSRT